jgi:hypothetical protein
MSLEVRIVRTTVRKDVGQHMTHRFADAQLTLRAAGACTSFLVAGHCEIPVVVTARETGDPSDWSASFGDYGMPQLSRRMK